MPKMQQECIVNLDEFVATYEIFVGIHRMREYVAERKAGPLWLRQESVDNFLDVLDIIEAEVAAARGSTDGEGRSKQPNPSPAVTSAPESTETE